MGYISKPEVPVLKTFVFFLFGLLFANMSLADKESNPSERQTPSGLESFDALTSEVKNLKEQIEGLKNTINQHGGIIEVEWKNTNNQFTIAVNMVQERFTVATLVGIGIAIGIVPAVVNLLSLPLIYAVTRRAVQNTLPPPA